VDDDAYIGVRETMAHIIDHAEGPAAAGADEKKE
jgi:hypothetical protein